MKKKAVLQTLSPNNRSKWKASIVESKTDLSTMNEVFLKT